jgi:hypothetical protein
MWGLYGTLPINDTEKYPTPVGIAPSGALFEATAARGAASLDVLSTRTGVASSKEKQY